jgi:hypothetical protein
MDAVFHAPQLGTVDVPLGLDGEGTIECSAEGIALSGQRHNPNTGSVFGLLGFLVGVVLAGASGWLMSTLGFSTEGKRGIAVPVAAFFGGLFGTIGLGRRVVKPKLVTFTVPWGKVKKLRVDPQTGLASFVSKGPLKGQVQVSIDGTLANQLVAEWTQAGLPHGLKV